MKPLPTEPPTAINIIAYRLDGAPITTATVDKIADTIVSLAKAENVVVNITTE